MKAVAGLIAAAVLAVSGAHALATGSTASGCQPAGKTLARDPQAVVYATSGAVYGCAQSTGVAFKLGTSRFCNNAARVDHVALAGTVAAYGIDQCGVDTGTAMIEVHRLTDNHALAPVQPAITGPLGPESYQSVGSLVVRQNGAVAWIARANSIIGRGRAAVEVHRVDSRGRPTVLDSGAAVAISSLRLHGTRLTWRHGRTTRSATLR